MKIKEETQLEKLNRCLAESRKWTLKFKEQEINYNAGLDDENGLIIFALIDCNGKKWINSRYRYNSMLFSNILLALPTESDLKNVASRLYKNADKKQIDVLTEAMQYFIDCFSDLIDEDDY